MPSKCLAVEGDGTQVRRLHSGVSHNIVAVRTACNMPPAGPGVRQATTQNKACCFYTSHGIKGWGKQSTKLCGQHSTIVARVRRLCHPAGLSSRFFGLTPTTRATSASFTHCSASKGGTRGRSSATRTSPLIYDLANSKSPHRYKHETNKDGLLEPLPHHPNLLPLSSHKSIAEHPAIEKLIGPRSKSAL